jgi:hypothetical protein
MTVYTSVTEALRDGWSVYDPHYELGAMLLRRFENGRFQLALCRPKSHNPV